MRTAYLDCFSGVSGNMLLGALLHAEFPEDVLRSTLDRLNLPDWSLDIEYNQISGLRSCLVRVRDKGPPVHRHLADICNILQHSSLDQEISTTAKAVFTRLARAEAQVHGTDIEKIHFHEVGAIDAIIDVVGVVAGFHYLNIQQISCSPLPMPRGWVSCAHGRLPLPAPAVCELLKKIPVYGDNLTQELVTPTGAALVAELANKFGNMPPMILEKTTYGAGTMQRQDGRPNLLRLVIGKASLPEEVQQVEVIETHLDDWNPELWPHVSKMLFKAGALDVSLVPIHMKKGRPGFLIRIIADPAHSMEITTTLFTETSCIGLRYSTTNRLTLPRESITLNTPWGEIKAKKVTLPDGSSRITPEYEDCKRLAQQNGIALQLIYDVIFKIK